MPYDRLNVIRAAMRWVMAIFYAAAGIAHLVAPDKLLAITPSWVPFAPQIILVTGLCELAGAVALVTTALRRWAGFALAAYALCVWPANFKHAIDGIDLPHIANSWFYHGPRLAFQPVLIWWALFFAEIIDWPWCPGSDKGTSVSPRRDLG
ncbi:MAG: DoxX family protein [Bradyrhizobium sp.]